jgi:hypothetical protein
MMGMETRCVEVSRYEEPRRQQPRGPTRWQAPVPDRTQHAAHQSYRLHRGVQGAGRDREGRRQVARGSPAVVPRCQSHSTLRGHRRMYTGERRHDLKQGEDVWPLLLRGEAIVRARFKMDMSDDFDEWVRVTDEGGEYIENDQKHDKRGNRQFYDRRRPTTDECRRRGQVVQHQTDREHRRSDSGSRGGGRDPGAHPSLKGGPGAPLYFSELAIRRRDVAGRPPPARGAGRHLARLRGNQHP